MQPNAVLKRMIRDANDTIAMKRAPCKEEGLDCLRSSSFGGTQSADTVVARAPRNDIKSVIARSSCDEAIQSFSLPWIAALTLAMTLRGGGTRSRSFITVFCSVRTLRRGRSGTSHVVAGGLVPLPFDQIMNCLEQPAPEPPRRRFGPAFAAALRGIDAFTHCCRHWLASTLGRQEFIGPD